MSSETRCSQSVARSPRRPHVDRAARHAELVEPLVQADRLEPRELEDREERRHDQRARDAAARP
jgi:hypothetical protein